MNPTYPHNTPPPASAAMQ